MILYQLVCTDGHEFEAWFRDGTTYDKQSASGDVSCPHCGDTGVSKALTALHVSTKPAAGDSSEKRARELATQILQAVEKSRQHVEENFDYVGDHFAEEARRIHYGETDERDIYGEATSEETDDLREEGIKIFRLPPKIRRNG
jgi:hypothetical protein